MKILNNILLLVLSLYLVACDDMDNRISITNDGVPPAAINSSDITVTAKSGGAVIKYKLPDESDLVAVEAQYVLSTGQLFKVRASSFADSIVVEGFLNATEYDINLFVVDRSENYSSATVVKITPNTSPIVEVLNTVNVTSDFGGMKVSWINQEESPIAVFVSSIVGNDTIELDAFYSSTEEGEFQIKGQDTTELAGFVTIRDKWQNYSETYSFTVNPLYETEIEIDKIKAMDDVHFYNLGTTPHADITKYFDNEDPGNYWPTNSTVPWYGSIDLTTKVKLSQIVFWQYAWSTISNYGHFYFGSNSHTWEVYGTNNPNPLGDADGEMDDSWVFIMECNIKKPSGLPFAMSNMTEDDKDQALNRGHSFSAPLEAEAYRYIRIRAMGNFDGGFGLGAGSRIDIFGDDRY